MLKGLDLSHWNRIYSYAAIDAQADFVILKATQGTNFLDATFKARLKRFRNETNVVVGAYHWLYKQDGARQARYFIKQVKAANNGTLDGVMMCVDVETTTWDGSLSAKFYSLEEFYDEFYRLTNRTLVVYTSPGYWNRMVRYARENNQPLPHKNRIPNTVLWKAHWVVRARGRDLEDTPAPPKNSPAWVPFGGYKDLAMLQALSLVKINGKPKLKGYDGNVSDQSKSYLASLTREGSPEDNGNGEEPTPCPVGYHREAASGICVPNDSDNDTGVGDGEVGYEDVAAGVTTAGIAGVGGGALLGVGIAAALVTVIYFAVKSGGKISPVVDRGESD